jgi:hypothetical protein
MTAGADSILIPDAQSKPNSLQALVSGVYIQLSVFTCTAPE